MGVPVAGLDGGKLGLAGLGVVWVAPSGLRAGEADRVGLSETLWCSGSENLQTAHLANPCKHWRSWPLL